MRKDVVIFLWSEHVLLALHFHQVSCHLVREKLTDKERVYFFVGKVGKRLLLV